LAGEIEALKGNITLSAEHFEKALNYEDELPYNEPAEWYIPTRQSYGAMLLKAKKYKRAEEVFRSDLSYYPNNGWSLMGLYQSLIGLDRNEEAKKVKEKFEIAWRNSDIEINSSVL